MREAIDVEARGPSGLWNVPVPNTRCAVTCVPDAGALAECGVPRVVTFSYSKQQESVCLYLVLRIFFRILEFFHLEFSWKHAWNLYVYFLMCVSSFLYYYVTY